MPWFLGMAAFALLVVLLPLLASSSEDRAITDVSAASEDSLAAKRARDSVSVLALANGGDTISESRLWQLENLAHYGGVWIAHEPAHRRFTSIVLDSASVLLNSGNTFAARGLLNSVTGPTSEADERRRKRLVQRVESIERAERENASRHAAESRIASIRAIKIENCTPPLRAVRNRVQKNPEWSDDIIAVTACGRVRMGMTREQAIAGWGRPQDINRTTHSFGVHEQWVYGEYGERGFLYFEDGILTTTQN